jgi:Lytic transglycolase
MRRVTRGIARLLALLLLAGLGLAHHLEARIDDAGLGHPDLACGAGGQVANAARLDMNAMTMAHKSLPFGTRVKVTNLANKRSVVVRVNDRGPIEALAAGRLAAVELGAVVGDLALAGATAAGGGSGRRGPLDRGDGCGCDGRRRDRGRLSDGQRRSW